MGITLLWLVLAHMFCKNVEKTNQNVDSRRLAPKSTKLTCYPILKIQSYIHRKKLKISKNWFSRYAGRRVLVQVQQIYQLPGMWDNLI